MIGMDNQLWLIDFGATQRTNVRSERTVIVKQGYAPIEQYYSDGSVFEGKIGAWTDVYALAATMYAALTGEKPRTSVERMKSANSNGASGIPQDDEWRALSGIFAQWQVAALMKGMAVNKAERFATMDEFIEALSFAPDDKDSYTRVVYREPAEAKKPDKDNRIFVLPVLLVLLLFVLVVYVLLCVWEVGEWQDLLEDHQVSADVENQAAEEKRIQEEMTGRQNTTTQEEQLDSMKQNATWKERQTDEQGQDATLQEEQQREQEENVTSLQERQGEKGQNITSQDKQKSVQGQNADATEAKQSGQSQNTTPQGEQQKKQPSYPENTISPSAKEGTSDSNDWLNSDDEDDLY